MNSGEQEQKNRRTGQPKTRRNLIILAAVLLVVLVIGVLVGNVFYTLALTLDSDKAIVLEADHNAYEGPQLSKPWAVMRKHNQLWLSLQDYEHVYLKSQDGLKLHGVEINNPAPSSLWFIGCHGYTGDYRESIAAGKEFFDRGYNVLIPDARGHGDSEGDYIGMGWHDRLDVVSWIDRIVEQDPAAQIVLYGVSMGGATVMMVAGEPLPSNVKAIVEDCGYTSIWDEFSYQLKELFKLPAFPVMHFSSLVTKVRAGYWLGEGSAVEQLKKTETPMLFIHGDQDTFVPFDMLDEVYSAATGEKEKLVVEGADHGMARLMDEALYWETVFSFVDRHVTQPLVKAA